MTTNQYTSSAVPLEDSANDHPSETVLVSEAAEPARPLPFPSRKSQQAIHDAVARLLEDACVGEEQRWTPRVSWVRAALLIFEQPENGESQENCTIPVATTDISFEGLGLLSWREIPVQHLLLQLCGFRFACDVRWSKRIGGQLYRYGLHFLHVMD